MSGIADSLRRRKCAPCEGGTPPMAAAQIRHFLDCLSGWEYAEGRIRKSFRFANHHEVMAFLNALAWISHREDHHPDVSFGYNQATVAYMTHSIGGISENDFICAAKVDELFDQ